MSPMLYNGKGVNFFQLSSNCGFLMNAGNGHTFSKGIMRYNYKRNLGHPTPCLTSASALFSISSLSLSKPQHPYLTAASASASASHHHRYQNYPLHICPDHYLCQHHCMSTTSIALHDALNSSDTIPYNFIRHNKSLPCITATFAKKN